MIDSVAYFAIGMTMIGLLGSALAIGKISSSMMDGISRNPDAADKIGKYGIIGLGLSESVALFALVG